MKLFVGAIAGFLSVNLFDYIANLLYDFTVEEWRFCQGKSLMLCVCYLCICAGARKQRTAFWVEMTITEYKQQKNTTKP